MALSTDLREQFLAEPHVAALAVSAGPDRGPLTVPIWYGYTPGGTAWIVTQAASRKARLIEAAGRFSLLVDRLSPTVRYVSVEGPVAGSRPATPDDVRAMAERYLPADAVPGYVEMSLAEHGAQVVVHLRPEHWLSADLG
ncbi:pyridoxamine 5'-phosphate oxidase family protein [Modestobacter italicus]|uniref:pyridoxamine 5'-phosphate oxidase family protein n=1 Tax=Modestobacter italicus (strain DSM 44449 / CECT 9708 / BC 501) TaxID=2732864 RepID=UPI001C97279B|nr:pyridoxamine 5'-phosphate oxidase family protein [Modestobacter italicus]